VGNLGRQGHDKLKFLVKKSGNTESREGAGLNINLLGEKERADFPIRGTSGGGDHQSWASTVD